MNKLLAVLIFVTSMVGCATVPPPPMTITTDPPGAEVFVNDQLAGISPFVYEFNFEAVENQLVVARKEGYFTETLEVDATMVEAMQYNVILTMVESPMWHATTTSRATNDWLMVIVNPDISRREIWQRMIDAVTKRFPELEEFDVNSGYIKSVVKGRRFPTPRGEFRLRSRFVAAVANEDPLTYKIKVISEWTDKGVAWHKYDRVFHEDDQLINELVDRFGYK
jgi:hypothetical protein